MRAARLILYALLLVVVLVATAVLIAVRNETEIAKFVLARIHDRTGIDIRVTGTRIGISSQIVIVLEHPVVVVHGDEIARLQDIRMVLAVPAIIFNSGLPIQRLVLDRPHIVIPSGKPGITFTQLPQLDAELVRDFHADLLRLQDTVTHLELVDADARQDQTMLISHLDVHIHQHTSDSDAHGLPWMVNFKGALPRPGVSGIESSGEFDLPPSGTNLIEGQIRYWGLNVRSLNLGPVEVSAGVDGDLQLNLDESGTFNGATHTNVRTATFGGSFFNTPVHLTDYQVNTTYQATPQQLRMSEITVSQATRKILVAEATMMSPLATDRTLSFACNGSTIDLAAAANFVKSIKGISNNLVKTLAAMSGNLIIVQASIAPREPLRRWTMNTLQSQLRVDATLKNVSYPLPRRTKLPPVQKINAQVAYSTGMLRVRQGSLRLGTSRLDGIFVDADLKRAPAKLNYTIRMDAGLDLDELYPAIADNLPALNPPIRNQLTGLRGFAPLAMSASGDLVNLSWQNPRDYRVTLTTDRVKLDVKQGPKTIALTAGTIQVRPSQIGVDHIRIVPGGSNDGFIILNGVVIRRKSTVAVRDVTAELRHVNIGEWLPLFVQPKVVRVSGPVDGLLTANTVGPVTLPMLKGKMTMTTGEFRLGILRSPITTRYVSAVLNGQAFLLNIAAGDLEGSPITLSLRIADITHPVLQLDATADRFDLPALSFIHTPWEHNKASPPALVAPVSGHVTVREGFIGNIPLSHVATDFFVDKVEWRVYNFTAGVAGGTINFFISGIPGPNNWTHVSGRIFNVDTALLLRLLNPQTASPITGPLSFGLNLWVDTDSDFFSSFGGYLSLKIQNGRLNRFTLLSRILGLINLKSWLTADVPDPRQTGLPFQTITGTFIGKNSVFSTDDMQLRGPILEMLAQGDINLGTSQVNLQVSVIPFLTANWVLSKIPIIGYHLEGGTKNLLAAYFHVTGPYKDPTVTPKPITSVAEFVKKILGLPVNIVVPNTIK